MLTRSKCMAASEAAGEKNWETERVSDTFHPPTVTYHSRSDAGSHIDTVRAAAESHSTVAYEFEGLRL